MKLIGAVVRSLVKNLANLGGSMVGVPVAGDIVVDAWDNWHQDDLKKMRAEIEVYARKSVKEAVAEAREALAAEAPHLSDAVREQIIQYASLVPGAIRRSLRRTTDRTGVTAPPGLVLRRAEDLLPFLPAKLPRFQAGDQPLPHTDLQLLELVGQGGFGEVWKAQHVDRPKAPPVALKFCLEPTAARSLDNERSLLDRIAQAGKFNGIVQLLYSHLRATPPCLEYEFVEGGDLTGLITDLHAGGARPKPEVVARIVLALTQIVAHAHRQQPPIVHRDLKPANILVTQTKASKEGQRPKLLFKITDFGIGSLAATKALRDHTTGKTKLAEQRMDMLLGAFTPVYSSPEQVKGEQPDPRDDVHALGVIWYQMQTGNLGLMTVPSHWRQDLLDCGMSEPVVGLLGDCIGRLQQRPADAADVVQRLEQLTRPPPSAPLPAPMPAADPDKSAAVAAPSPHQRLKEGKTKTDGAHVNFLLRRRLVVRVGLALIGLLVTCGLIYWCASWVANRNRETADRINLKQIGLAVHSYHDLHKTFPAFAVFDKKEGVALLSWRVAILPHLGRNDLYLQFKLDEPWDSAHNKKLIANMPDIYKESASPKTPAGETHYLAYLDVEDHTAIGLKTGVRILQITDGTANTIMCVQASRSVPWTKPEDIPYAAARSLPKPPDFYGRGVFLALFCDGEVHALPSNLDQGTMRAYITRDGNEPPLAAD